MCVFRSYLEKKSVCKVFFLFVFLNKLILTHPFGEVVLLQRLQTKDVKFMWLTSSGRTCSQYFSLHVSHSCVPAGSALYTVVGSTPREQLFFLFFFSPH